MKFVLQYNRQLGVRPTDNIEAGQLVLKAFSGWSPPDGLTIREHAVRVDGRGGVLVCEADDARIVYSFVT